MEGHRSELDGLLTEILVTGSGGELGNEDLSILRRHGRMYRLLGLIPTALGSADEVTDAWKTLVELFLALRLRLVQSVSGCGGGVGNCSCRTTFKVAPAATRGDAMLRNWWRQGAALR